MLSFQNATLVLSIADKISEVHNCGMAREKQTLHVGLLADNSMFQICSDGIRHISVDMKIIQFTTDGSIVCATSNPRQIVIALDGGDLIYF